MRESILIIDNDSEIVKELTKLLDSYDVNLLYAPDLSLAADTIKNLKLALILSDYDTPKYEDDDIFELCRRTPNEDTPKIALSDKQIHDYSIKGYNGALIKPISPEDFNGLVGNMLPAK